MAFTKSFMNGAILFGVSVTLFALGMMDNFSGNKQVVLLLFALIYLIISMMAFIFPSLSKE